MADWFKFYENDLDETRLQYAISKLPEVVSVWVGILSEACRHKSGTVSWGGDDIELFGFSRRLGVSIPKVNEAISLLCSIRYITKQEGHITIIKWSEKQSDYCQKRTRMQNQSGEKHHTKTDRVRTLSGHTPDNGSQEERRGEENNIEREQADFPEVVIPTQAEVLEWAKMDGISEDAAKAFFAHYDSKNLWVNKYGRAIDARKSLKVWANNEPRFAAKAAPQGNGTHSKVAPTVFNLKSIIEAKTEQANGLKARWAAEGPLTTDWSSEQAKQDYLKLRKEIKELKTKLATTPV